MTHHNSLIATLFIISFGYLHASETPVQQKKQESIEAQKTTIVCTCGVQHTPVIPQKTPQELYNEQFNALLRGYFIRHAERRYAKL